MPQMSCLNWIFLFLYFSFVLYGFISFIYFLYNPPIDNPSATEDTMKQMNDFLEYWFVWM